MLKRLYHKLVDSATRELRERLIHIEDKQNELIERVSHVEDKENELVERAVEVLDAFELVRDL